MLEFAAEEEVEILQHGFREAFLELDFLSSRPREEEGLHHE